jgi:hypothetical protein
VVPASFFGRLAALVYALLCVSVLVFAYVRQDIHDMPEAFAWFMIFLEFPVAFLVAPLFGVLQYAATQALGIPYQPFWDLVPGWVALSVAGYAQWFIVLPYAVGRLLRARPGA